MSNSEVLSTFTALSKHHLYFQNISVPPTGDPITISSHPAPPTLRAPHRPAPGNSAFCLCASACSGYLGISYKKKPTIHGLLSLASFTEHTVFEGHPSRGTREHVVPFYGGTVSRWVAGPRFVRPPIRDAHVGCPASREDAAVGRRVRVRAGVPAFNSLGTARSYGNCVCNFLKDRLEFLYKVKRDR